MNKKAILAILIALIVPLAIFLFVDSLPKASPPRPLFYDSVGTVIKKGKRVPDTIWQHLPDFTLINQLGHKVSFSDIALKDSGKITIIDFFFTHCPNICPGMTVKMKRLQDILHKNVKVGDKSADFIQFISISIDPDRDSVPELRKWASKFNINPDNWWLLTGDKKTIYDLSLKYMNLDVQDPSIDSVFPHTDIFTLVDKQGIIRVRRDQFGNPQLYHSQDEEDMSNLAKDIVLLSLEKNKNEKNFFTGKLMLIAIVFLSAIAGVFLLLFFLRKNNKKDAPTTVAKE